MRYCVFTLSLSDTWQYRDLLRTLAHFNCHKNYLQNSPKLNSPHGQSCQKIKLYVCFSLEPRLIEFTCVSEFARVLRVV